MRSRYEQFAGSVLCLYRYIQKIQRVEMAKYGLKGSHAQCLLVMNRYPDGITAAQLSHISDKDKAAISRTLSELAREGLVERRSSTNSYRAPLFLTDKGLEAAMRVDQIARRAVEQAGLGLTDTRREEFYATLDLLASNLHRISQVGLDTDDNLE